MKTSKTITIKRNSTSKNRISKGLDGIVSIFKNSKKTDLIKGGIGLIAATGAAAAAYKIYNYNTKEISISNKIKSEEDAIKVIFNPKEIGLWSGDQGIAALFLNEYLYTLPNVCNTKKYRTYGIVFAHDGTMAITKDRINSVPVDLNTMVDLFREIINTSECSSKRFFIIPIAVVYTSMVHSNTLIYDSKNKSMDHFEPYGSDENMMTIFDPEDNTGRQISRICSNLDITYNNKQKTCPNVGPQLKEALLCPILRLLKNDFKTNIGFCLIWSLWYIELRLKNPDTPSKQLIKEATKDLGTNLCRFITGYAANVLNFSKKFDLVVGKDGKIVDYKEKGVLQKIVS